MLTECEFLKPPAAARFLGVGHEAVLSWIHTGELRACDLSARRGGRPRWRINRADLEAFLARRVATPAPRQRRKSSRRAAEVIEFY